jgi:hypothetical protein
MKYKSWLTLLFITTVCSAHAQKTFSFGSKAGLGGSAFPLNATFASNGIAEGVRPMTIFTTGAMVQYMITYHAGIESGTHITHYGYYKNETSVWQNLTGEDPVTQVFNYQIPVVLLYRVKMPANPFKYVMFAGGTSIDWITADALTTFGEALSLENLYCSVRMGREKVKGKRIEFGLEFQHSFRRFYLKEVNYKQIEESLSSRLSLLTLNFYYFFWNKTLIKEDLDVE